MKPHPGLVWVAGALLTGSLLAQSPPPASPAPRAGLLNAWLRQQQPAFTNWDVGGSARVRYEQKYGFGIPGVPGSVDFRDDGVDVNNAYGLERLRYRVGYQAEWWSVRVEGRSSFAQNDERWAYFASPLPPGTRNRRGDGPEADTVDLHQAFFTIGNLKEFPLLAQLGRQELSYGEERLVGAFAWNNIGRVFDAAKVRWQTDAFGVDLFTGRVVIPADGRFNRANDYDWFSGCYANFQPLPQHLLDVYFFARNASPQAIAAEPSPQAPQPSARDIYTLGVRLRSKPGALGNWDYVLETAGQLGNFQDRRLPGMPRLDHAAWMVVLRGGHTFRNAPAQPGLALEYSFGSGDDDPTDAEHGTFENLFPTNHKFYGGMDLVSLQNIHNLRGILTLKPHARLTLTLEGHGFWLATTHDNFYTVAGAPRGGVATTPGNHYGVNPDYEAWVGAELDVLASYVVAAGAQIEAGYGHFFRGDYIRRSLSALGSRDADWFYVQAVVTF